jgi:hypothetical protein
MTVKLYKRTILIACIAFISSCTNPEIEKDAKAVAELQCKSQKLIEKAANSNEDILEESQKISLEAATLFSKMQGKYLADHEQEQFLQAYNEALENCK